MNLQLSSTLNEENSRPVWLSLLIAAGIGVVAGILVGAVSTPIYLIAAALAGLAVLGTVYSLDLGLMVLCFMVYMRLSDVLIYEHGAPSIALPWIVLLCAVLVLRWITVAPPKRGWEAPAAFISLVGLVGLASILVAAEPDRVVEASGNFAKNGLIAVLLVLLLHRLTTLRRVVWVLIAAGLIMGSVSVYQHQTGTFETTYWGYGRAAIKHIVGRTDSYRVSGPLGDPNFFALILIPLVPLAIDRMRNEPSRMLRVIAGATAGICSLAIIFTYSRGGFVALLFVLGMLLLPSFRRPIHAVSLLVLILLLTPLLPSSYVERMRTIPVIGTLFGEQREADSALRGRRGEMAVGMLMFLEHPLLGVGLQNYPVQFQKYSLEEGIDSRKESRTPHNLYLEIAAENGLLGLVAFGLLLGGLFHGLKNAGQNFAKADLADGTHIVNALRVSILAYLVGSMFLHGAYPRFFWLLVGVAFGAARVADLEVAGSAETEKDVLPAPAAQGGLS